MVFSELSFLCLFFTVLVLLYFLLKSRIYRNVILLVFSLIFYAWGEPIYILLMIAVTLVAYVGGICIFKAQEAPKCKGAIFIATVSIITCNLLFFKYTNFFLDNLGLLLHRTFPVPSILLPIGISFYTFQILSYVIDLYWGKVGLQRNFFYLLLYLSFFPQLIAGPIVRYSTVEYEIEHRQETWDDAAQGIRRFIIGLAKKVILANHVAPISEIIYGGSPEVFGTAMYWVAAFAYTMQLYFDFSAYSDMAIGIGQLFGFHFLENFNHPYSAVSITDFWRRWHISLSTWFRDYIYIPLGGNRVSVGRHIFNLAVVWGLTGFWHGASWNFILWGIYYGLLLILEKFLLGKFLQKLPKLLAWAYQFVLVNVGWVIFNLTDLSRLGAALKTMFVFVPTQWDKVLAYNTNILLAVIYLPLAFVLSFPIGSCIKRKDTPGMTVAANLGYLLLLGTSLVFILSSSYNPFIYFRF